MAERRDLSACNRWVLKFGSALLTADGKGLDQERISDWVRQIAGLHDQGREFVLVSSGAVAEGMQRLGWQQRPVAVDELQAAAAVGQMGLIQAWEEAFAGYGLHTAQVLLDHDDLSNRTRYLNARSTLKKLLKLGVIPVVNENDTVVTEEIRFGDNDTLAALVTNLVEAEGLVILTDQQGLYESDPRRNKDACLVPFARACDDNIVAMAGEGGGLGRGGMVTKVRAARLAARSGANTLIASGREDNVIGRLLSGDELGTCLAADQQPLAARKQWLAGQLQMQGALVLDDGAVRVLRDSGKSLLPVGVIEVEGDFSRGALVVCRNRTGDEIARGLVNYNADEARRIMGQASSEIASVLGYCGDEEIIHRDNLVITL
jgi:glutamate 5-kinase